MRRTCPNCKSLNVRRSSREPDSDADQPFYRSPYRCRDCRTKFWAFSTKLYRRIIVVGAVVGVMLILMLAIIISAEIGGPSFGMDPILARVAFNLPLLRRGTGGRCEIRTHGAVADTPDFKSGALDRSANLPRCSSALKTPVST